MWAGFGANRERPVPYEALEPEPMKPTSIYRPEATYSSLCNDLDSGAGELKRLIREMDRSIDTCRKLLDRVQPLRPGRIELVWRVRNRTGGLPGYPRPRFVKVVTARHQPFRTAAPRLGRPPKGSKPKREKWYQREIPSSHLTLRVGRTVKFRSAWPAIESTLTQLARLVQAREEVVRELQRVGTTQRRLARKYAETIGYARAFSAHVNQHAIPYLMPPYKTGGGVDVTRAVLNAKLLREHGRVLTVHGAVPEKELPRHLRRRLTLEWKDVLATPELFDSPEPQLTQTATLNVVPDHFADEDDDPADQNQNAHARRRPHRA